MAEVNSKGRIRDLRFLSLLFKALDIVLIYSLLYLMSKFFPHVAWEPSYIVLGLISISVFLFASESANLYQSWRGVEYSSMIKRVFLVWGVTVLSLMTLGYLMKLTAEYSRILVGLWVIIVPLTLLIWRAVLKMILNYFRSSGYNSRQVAVLGVNGLSDQIVQHLDGDKTLGFRIQGLYDDRESSRDDGVSCSIIGCTDQLVESVKAGEIDLVYITLPMKAEKRIKEVIDKLADTTATVYLVPDIYTYQLFNGEWTSMAGHPVVSVFESPFLGMNSFVKRVQDIILSTVILALISPVMLGISIAVRMTSPGPALFKQRRYGVSGEEIDVWKFRSMTAQDNGSVVKQAVKNDTRITPLGNFLRRTSLDELPQFINVIKGEMSIVGPRPHAVVHNELYRSQIRGYMLRHAVKPGITGWAQINGWRGETEEIEKMEGRVNCDLWYISNWSSWLDIKIIFLTIFKGLVGKNAY